ncbi:MULTISPECIES: cache domain-containing sensor histidine kinase [Cohnella]|uniref:cache domain-containing sensor histidine kinase n=1 Tax=Cohnella TaxID=329857 RepID=UPI0009BB7E1E|nr:MULTISPECIES: sensor histidine kinase [Cohnella]MBN2984157.1 histidine kinase [Cohnella algarum]
MRRNMRNIQTVLFSTYTLIIVLVFAVLIGWFYLWASETLRRNATDSIDSIGGSMRDQIDSELRKMNDVSLNVMYSNLVKDHFRKYLSYAEGGAPQDENEFASPSREVESAKELADILTAAIGPSRPVEQLYLYDFEGVVYGNGFDNGERRYDPETKDWFAAVLNNAEGKYLHPPVLDEDMSKFISSREPQYSVSLFRLFYDHYNSPIGIVEVKQYYNKIFKSVLDYESGGGSHDEVLVFDRNGNVLYPLDASPSRFEPYIELVSGFGESGGADRHLGFRNPDTGDRELLSLHRSEFSGWSTVFIVSEKRLLQPLTAFAKQTVPIAFLILLFAIVLSYVAARKITFPILKIHRMIRNIRLDDLGAGRFANRELNSGLNELDQLHQAFVHMNIRLKQSMDDLLLAQSQELQSRLVALQAQMNPHFLYNTLTTIGVMAEENMNGQIVAMSEAMADMLRYITSDESEVPFAAELEHTRMYGDIHRIRHGGKLELVLEAEQSLMAVRIPKLIVQPLVENSLKHAAKRQPPWIVRVSGEGDARKWVVRVADNGPGFSEESLAKLREKMEETGRTGTVPALKLDGMGLLSVYFRLRLSYGKEAVFSIENRAEGGATVTIGRMPPTD